VLRDAVVQTMLDTCGMLLWLSFGATAMIGVYNLAGGPAFIKRSDDSDSTCRRSGRCSIMMAVLIVLGCIMDWVGICLLTMPIFVPIVVASATTRCGSACCSA
jgi:TRAP-type mannitol/chloroaromatic compound transport system permease large subunit